MRTWALSVVLVMLVMVAPRAWADGGALVARQTVGQCEITVFAAPRPLVAGPVDLSVLVQDARTGQPIPAAEISLTLTPRDSSQATIQLVASAEAAANKLLQACTVELTEGVYDIGLNCRSQAGVAQLDFPLEVGSPPTGWTAWWPWFSWPALPIAVYVACQLGDERRRRKLVDEPRLPQLQ